MKRLLLFPLVLVLTSCGYGSRYEALDACHDWVEKGPLMDRRPVCRVEKETKQVLGFDDKYGKVIKRFGY